MAKRNLSSPSLRLNFSISVFLPTQEAPQIHMKSCIVETVGSVLR